jgi:4'-phosphopantetheinyl transferase
MRRDLAHAGEWRPPPHPPLGAGEVHVWRVSLDVEPEPFQPLLSPDERQRAARFHRDVHRRRFVAAHGALRRILGAYLDAAPETLAFEVGEHGKPSLREPFDREGARVEFNLSHSADLALVAVTRNHPVGVDVERWSEVEHLELAERFFSSAERDALRSLAHVTELLEAGFFAAWTRKEAYLKATGYGIARGLHHFDVTLAPGVEAALLADRLDAAATQRWTVRSIVPAEGYSGAVVAAAPLRDLLLFDADPWVARGTHDASSG